MTKVSTRTQMLLAPRAHRLHDIPARRNASMLRVLKSLAFCLTASIVLSPARAGADGFITPWVGSAFGSGIQNGQANVGVSAGAMGAGIIGGEVDFGWSPSFFGTTSD